MVTGSVDRSLRLDRAVGRIGSGSVVIDGEVVPFEEFSEILQAYEGFLFKLRIVEPYGAL